MPFMPFYAIGTPPPGGIIAFIPCLPLVSNCIPTSLGACPLRIFHTCIMQYRSLLLCSDIIFSRFSLSQYIKSLHPETRRVNALWTSSSFWISPIFVGFQTGQQYSSFERTILLYRVSITVADLSRNALRVQAAILRALWTVFSICGPQDLHLLLET